jgi:hypothetical protein
MNKLWVYISFDDKEPDKNKCQQSFNTPLSFKVFAPFKAKKFEFKNLYVSLHSEQGCSIKLGYSFHEPIQRLHKRQDKEVDLDYDDDPSKDPFAHLIK